MSPVTAADEIRPLYRAVVVLGVAAIVILSAGLVEFFHFEPLGQRTGTAVRLRGVFAYDPASGRVSGPDRSQFTIDQDFAAVVDWGSLPPGLVVGARWYNGFGTVVGSAGPRPAGQLVGHEIVPVKVPPGLSRNLPGEYVFVVERYRGGQPVEVLARRFVMVRRRL